MVRSAHVGAVVALWSVAGAVRRVSRKKVGGVTMLNYNDRFMQHSNSVGIQAEENEYDWVLKFRAGLGDETITEVCGGSCVSQGHAKGVPFATVRGTEAKLEALLSNYADVVEWVEPDTPVDVEGPVEEAEPMADEIYSLERIGVDEAQYTGEGVNIYVMDTGVRSSHEDFEGRAIPTIDTIAGSGRVVECNGDVSCSGDTHGHGTHVAGTSGGKRFGVAKKATVRALKVCCGAGTNIIAGMDWLVLNRVRPAVMTMSLGSYSMPESSRTAVNLVVDAGITVTVSAGNRNYDSCQKSYSFIASAIAVAASDESNTRTSWSNWGVCNAIFAPGMNIVSASKDSDTGATTMSGTSMAAPAVAGASALLLQQYPSLTADGVRDLLQSRSKKGVIKQPKNGDPNMLLWVGN